ncbi:MAG: NUDIX domain-containing protein [Anaerolineae bacterium]
MFILTTLVYTLRGDQVLLMKRRKQPNLGLWVAPGGKIEENESPVECAARELSEETGLTAGRLALRGIITEWSPRTDWRWLMFVYTAHGLSGSLVPDEREGEIRWWPLAEVPSLPMPEADQVFVPHVLNPDGGLYQARFVYDSNLKVSARFDAF